MSRDLGCFSRHFVGHERAMSVDQDQAGHTRGDLAPAISTAFVRLLKEHADRGPTRCRTYIDDELIIVLMRGGYSRLENTLFEDGKWLDVRSTRHAFSDTMKAASRNRSSA
jgi:uncharacterized protein YbcI